MISDLTMNVDATDDVGQWSSMDLVNGNPGVVYYDITNGKLKYARFGSGNINIDYIAEC